MVFGLFVSNTINSMIRFGSTLNYVLAPEQGGGCDCEFDQNANTTIEKQEKYPVTITVDLKKLQTNIGEIFKGVEVIPLETNEKSVFGRVAIVESHNDKYFLFERFGNLLMSFDKDGRFITNYIKFGKGPGETASMMSYRVDEDNSEVVISAWDKQANIVFNIDGKYLREDPMIINNEDMHKFANGHVAYYTGKPMNIIDNKPNFSTLIILDQHNQKSFVGVDVPYIKKSGYVLYQSFHTFKDDLYFKYPYGDTIYQVFPDHLDGKYVIDFGKHNIDWDNIDKDIPRKIHFEIDKEDMASINHFFWEYNNWIFFAISHKRNYYYAFYNKVSKETKLYDTKTLINNEFGILGRIVGTTETEVICLVEPLDLLYPEEEIIEPKNEQFAKELSSLIKELQPTDNPVLLKFELK